MKISNKNKSDVSRPSPFKVSPSTTSHTPPRNEISSPDYVKSGSSSIKSFEGDTWLGTNTTPRTETYFMNTDIMNHDAVPKPLAPQRSCEVLSRTSDLRTVHATGYPVDEQRSIGNDQNVGTPSLYEYNRAKGAVYSEEAKMYPYQSSNVWSPGGGAFWQDQNDTGYDVSPLVSSTAPKAHDNRSEVSSLRLSHSNTSSEHRMPHAEQAGPAPPELLDISRNEPSTVHNPKHIITRSFISKAHSRSNSTRKNCRSVRRCQKHKSILVGGTVLVLVALLVVVVVLVVHIWDSTKTYATSKTHSSTSSVATRESVTHHSKHSATTTAAVTT